MSAETTYNLLLWIAIAVLPVIEIAFLFLESFGAPLQFFLKGKPPIDILFGNLFTFQCATDPFGQLFFPPTAILGLTV